MYKVFSLKKSLIKFLATAFGAGYVPKIPGTIGSLWGVLLFYILSAYPFWYQILVTLAVCVLSIPLSHEAEKIIGTKDAKQICIDEVAGQLVTYLFVSYSLPNLVMGFVLFRLFDILKIFPANWAQDELPGGMGIATDDIIAGIQAGLVLLIVGAFI
ncbi:MAG: hypothetical protein A2048_09425 [Deltaproteobacteria bacterium GWA2_45_12]|nr:MAG: hypothetical protein A2048_09425 [Deltaproteobacteria bacterium GWA2_45_12]